ncbi:recombinase family protein [Spirillospora sp. NBC_00431]
MAQATRNGGNGKRQKSRSWVAPDLVSAVESGTSFGEWLDGRIPVASKARISADHKKDEHGVAAQHKANEREARRNNLAIVKYYEDNDLTAAKENLTRDSFELLVKEVRARRTSEGFPITGVMCLETERLYRRAGDYERIVDALTLPDDNGVLYESGNKRFIDLYSDFAEYEGLIGVAKAKGEIRKISRRMRDSHGERALRGAAVGGPRRYGYLGPDKRTGRASNEKKNPAEWETLKWMVSEAAAGRAWNSIATDLNDRGILTVRGKLWTPTSVRSLLRNPFLCGYRVINDELVKDEGGEPIIGTWDKAATVEQHMAIQERIRLAKAQRGLLVEDADFSMGSMSTRTRKYLYSGFLRCGREYADGRVCNQKWKGGGRDGKSYCCSPTGQGGCGASRHRLRVDEYLTELVLRQHEKLKAKRGNQVTQPWEKAEDLKEARNDVAELKRQWRKKTVGNQFFYEEFPRLEATVKRLEAEERKYTARQQRRASDDGTSLRDRWESLDLAQKRAAIGEVLIAVIVKPLSPGAAKKGPFDPTLLTPVWRETDQVMDPGSPNPNGKAERAA